MNAAGISVRETSGKGWMYWTGWLLSLWPTLIVGMSSFWKLSHNAWYVKEFTRIGWPESALPLLACLQLGALILFLIPRTGVLGAILLTGYLGGAIASYVRIGEFYPPVVPLSTAIVAWAGLFGREKRVRDSIPFLR